MRNDILIKEASKISGITEQLESITTEYTILKSDSDTLQEAINKAITKKSTLDLKPIRYMLTKQLIIDISKCKINGNGAIFDFSNAPNDLVCIKIIGSNESPYFQNGNFLKHIEIVGKGASSLQIAIQFESDNPSRATSHINLDGLNIHDFNKGIVYKTFAYLIRHNSVDIFRCDTCVEMPTGGNDYGENINYYGCTLYNSNIAVKGANNDGAFHFTSCSIDYNNVTFDISGTQKLFFVNGHIEGNGVIKGGNINITNSWIILLSSADDVKFKTIKGKTITIKDSNVNSNVVGKTIADGEGKVIFENITHLSISDLATNKLNDTSSSVNVKTIEFDTKGTSDNIDTWTATNGVLTIDTSEKETGDFSYKFVKQYGSGSKSILRLYFKKSLNANKMNFTIRLKSNKTDTISYQVFSLNRNGIRVKPTTLDIVDKTNYNYSLSHTLKTEWHDLHVRFNDRVLNSNDDLYYVDINCFNLVEGTIWVDSIKLFEY